MISYMLTLEFSFLNFDYLWFELFTYAPQFAILKIYELRIYVLMLDP